MIRLESPPLTGTWSLNEKEELKISSILKLNVVQCIYVLMIFLLGGFVNGNGIKSSHDFGLSLFSLKALENL